MRARGRARRPRPRDARPRPCLRRPRSHVAHALRRSDSHRRGRTHRVRAGEHHRGAASASRNAGASARRRAPRSASSTTQRIPCPRAQRRDARPRAAPAGAARSRTMPAVVESQRRAWRAACRRAAPPRNLAWFDFRCRTNTSWPHLDAHYRGMPPVAAMEVAIAGYDGSAAPARAAGAQRQRQGLRVRRQPRLADDAGGVGARCRCTCRRAGMAAEVFVADSQVRYLAPLFARPGGRSAGSRPTPTGTRSSPRCAERGRARTDWWRASRCPKAATRRPSPPVTSPSGKG